MDNQKIEINNDDDAYRILAQLLNDELIVHSLDDVQLGEWPQISVKYTDAKGVLNSNITADMASAIVSLQTAIDRVFAYQLKGKANAGYLNQDEEKAVQILVKVEKGSAALKAILTEILKTFGTEFAKKMDAKHVLISIITLGLIAAGSYTSVNIYGKYSSASEKFAAGKEETKRMELITTALTKSNNQQILENAVTEFEEPHKELIKGGIGIADTIEWQGESFSEGEARDIVSPTKGKSEPIRLDDIYKITKYDFTKEDEPKLYLIGVYNDFSFNAILPLTLIHDETSKKKLSEALLGHRIIKCKINASKLRGVVHNAEILDIDDLTAEEKSALRIN